MKTKIGNKWGNRIMEWIGEASLGCLESSCMSAYLQHQIPGLMQSWPSHPVHRFPRRRGHAYHWGKAGWRVGLFLLAGILASLPASAQELGPNQHWIEQVDGGFVLPVSPSAAAGYAMGYGGDILVGYRFDRHLSLSADLGYYDCDQKISGASAGEWVYVPVMAVGRYNFGAGPVRPYLLLGAGVAVNTNSLTPSYSGQVSNRETNLLLAPGAGILFVVSGDTALYLQGRLDLNFADRGGPFTDRPSVFVPLKAGMSFFVL